VFAVAAGIGAVITIAQPDFRSSILPPEITETIDRHEMWTHSVVAMKPYASSRIMTNNISVALMTFASGITGAVGTVYLLFFNGLMIGVVGAACASAGMSLSLWSFVAPHGVLELPTIFIAGGAGFRLAQGLLFPGHRPRRTALTVAAREAVLLALGCAPLLVVAGVVEAFVSPTGLPVWSKFLVAGSLFTLLVVYLRGPETAAR